MIATIVLPLTLLAGIYGMNFENMPELKWEWGYFAVLGIMATAIVFAAMWFWARGWIASGRRRVSRIISLAVNPERLIGHARHASRKHRE